MIITDVIDQLPTVPYKLATKDDLDETVRLVEAYGRRAIAAKADVRSQEQLDAAVAAGIAEFGTIDILIANAGIWTLGAFWELTDEQWDEMIGVNLTGVWKAAKAVAPHMIERRSGSIVIIASVNALGGRPVHRALCGRQARPDRADAQRRAGSRPIRRPVQCHQPGRGQDAHD